MLGVGCGDDGGGQNGSEGTGSTTDASTDTTLDPSTTGGSTGSADETGNDDGPIEGECLLWEFDECGADRKCMPYSVEDDRLPDTVQCCDAIDNPDLEGEPCQISGYDGSCMDTCEVGTMCLLDNDEMLTGQCRRFCDPDAPACGNDQTCKAFFELLPGVPNIPLCMDKCDPLLQDCSQPGWHCIPDTPTESGQSGFLCTPPPPSTPKGVLETCALANDCEAGLVCVTASRVPDCAFTSCCTAYCDLEDGDATCQAIHPDLECVDWMSPDPTWANVGACAVPG